MIAILLVLVSTTTLVGPFGEAGASAEPDDQYLQVTVEVRVDPSYQADYVVVHVLNPDGQETFPLGAIPGGGYAGDFSILPFNRALVFEAGREGDFVQSRVVSLLDLGVDPELLQTTFRPPESATDRGRWGWLALGAGALAGAALLGWFLLPKPAPAAPGVVDAAGDGTE